MHVHKSHQVRKLTIPANNIKMDIVIAMAWCHLTSTLGSRPISKSESRSI
jgi:hypothetical protein